jgi:serine-type D-Ala-D-Ala carboxypeptidase/endopeptidase
MSKLRLKAWLAFSLICTLGCGAPKEAQNYQQAAAQGVKSYLAAHPYAAVTVGIIDDQGVHVYGFGWLNPGDKHSPPNGKTIYQIGSITKVFTTTMLAEQVVLDKMNLDNPVQNYLPASLILPKEKDREILLTDLATHYSGLPRMPQLFGLFMIGSGSAENPYSLLTGEQLARMLQNVWLSSAIGSQYEYSNLGMGILAQALVHSTNSRDYMELVRHRITKPLNLPDTSLVLSEEQISRLAPAQLVGGQRTVPWHFASLEGCGALYSTADDLLSFAAANLGLSDTPLAKAMQLARQPQSGRTWSQGSMGLGWHLQNVSQNRVPLAWHNGMTGGYASMLMLAPDKELAVVVLSNVAASVDEPAVNVIRMLVSGPPAKGS